MGFTNIGPNPSYSQLSFSFMEVPDLKFVCVLLRFYDINLVEDNVRKLFLYFGNGVPRCSRKQ